MCVETLNQFPGGYFSSYLERISDLWTPRHLLMHELSGLLPIPSPKAASSSSLGTMHQGYMLNMTHRAPNDNGYTSPSALSYL